MGTLRPYQSFTTRKPTVQCSKCPYEGIPRHDSLLKAHSAIYRDMQGKLWRTSEQCGGGAKHKSVPRRVTRTLKRPKRSTVTKRLLGRLAAGPDGCLLFTGPVNTDGYGQISSESTSQAHRVAYELFVGPIPDGLHIDHLCHNRDLNCQQGRECLHRRCCKPEHLEAVTPAENVIRRDARRKAMGRKYQLPTVAAWLADHPGSRWEAIAAATAMDRIKLARTLQRLELAGGVRSLLDAQGEVIYACRVGVRANTA